MKQCNRGGIPKSKLLTAPPPPPPPPPSNEMRGVNE